MFKNKLLKYIIFDVLRSKVVIVYSLFLMLFTLGILYLGNDISKATISLLNVVLLLVPLISIVFGTMYFYNLKEFKELLLSQPVSRTSIILGEYFGLSVSLAFSFLIGVGAPLMIAGFTVDNLFLLLVGTFLTFIFVGLAFLSSVITSDKVKGMGIALFIWFYFSIIFDGLV
ncbi:MAG: ABC transporter permease subunit, partial [Candidatus Sericytochromatia bacterium]